MHLSSNLKRIMMERNLTQKKLASDLGIPLSTVHGWLNGVLPKSITDL